VSGRLRGALPPRFLIERVARPSDESDEQILAAFTSTGDQSVDELERTVTAAGRSLTQFERVLDWGCGPGRVVLRLLERYPGLQVAGVDTDQASVDWLRRNASAGDFRHTDPLPPTSFDDESFDLVTNHSVLTHLDELSQRRWLAEIVRLLRPEGWVIASVHGVHALVGELQVVDASTREAWLAAWRAKRFVFVADDAFVGSGHHDGYHTTFQDPATIEMLSDYALEPLVTVYRGDIGYQDQIVLRKRSPTERARRQTIEQVAHLEEGNVEHALEDGDASRLSSLERALHLSNTSLNLLGRRVSRLEDVIVDRQTPLRVSTIKTMKWSITSRVGRWLNVRGVDRSSRSE
jgi:SAM-dependent methyltransferase